MRIPARRLIRRGRRSTGRAGNGTSCMTWCGRSKLPVYLTSTTRWLGTLTDRWERGGELMVKKVMASKNWTTFGFVLFLVCLIPAFLLDNVRAVGTFWAFVAAITATVFVVAYGLLANWRRNPDGTRNQSGQHLMTFTIVIGSVMWLVVASRFGLVPPEWSPVLTYCIYAAVAFLLIWRLALLTNAQVKSRRKRRARAADGHR